MLWPELSQHTGHSGLVYIVGPECRRGAKDGTRILGAPPPPFALQTAPAPPRGGGGAGSPTSIADPRGGGIARLTQREIPPVCTGDRGPGRWGVGGGLLSHVLSFCVVAPRRGRCARGACVECRDLFMCILDSRIDRRELSRVLPRRRDPSSACVQRCGHRLEYSDGHCGGRR